LAPGIVSEWSRRLKEMTSDDNPKALEADKLAADMRRWQNNNGIIKTPD
jgi:hypothetical protein